MQTQLSKAALQLEGASLAQRVLRNCVHCGFCNATCPTYQLLGDELDGPRGRIYQMKELFERGEVSKSTRQHLDRCLLCRNCETTCPSGVQYHTLLEVGRTAVEAWSVRPWHQRLTRKLLRMLLPQPGLFKLLLTLGRCVMPLLPAILRNKLPRHIPAPGRLPSQRHPRVVLMLEGCVQPALSPNTHAAAVRLLDRLGIRATTAPNAGCCGAVDFHLEAHAVGLDRARRNIDAWWPFVEAGVEAIVQTASGCGAFVKEYGVLLQHDPAYAQRAQRVSALAKDLVEVMMTTPLESLPIRPHQRLAFHCSCTLQHAQKLGGAVESVLTRMGFELTPVPDSHLCCGSAGTYAITQPKIAGQLRDRKLDALESGHPDLIATANIGCQTHLDSARRTPVRHWIEVVEEALEI